MLPVSVLVVLVFVVACLPDLWRAVVAVVVLTVEVEVGIAWHCFYLLFFF